MTMYVFRIRTARIYTINDLLANQLSASTADCFDDKTEMEWTYNLERVVKFIINKKAIGEISDKEFNDMFKDTKHIHDEKDLREFVNRVVDPKDSPYKKSVLVSCLSKKNIADDEEMWSNYTNKNSKKGFLLVYDKEELITKCKSKDVNTITYDDVKYDSRDKLDITDYWQDWFYIVCKNIDYSKNKEQNKKNANTKLEGLNHTYLDPKKLMLTKNIEWSYQEEWRIIIDNPNYNQKTHEYNDGYKYGYTIIAKPKAIYIRSKVPKQHLNKIIEYAKDNNIELYLETRKDDLEIFKNKYTNKQ